MHTDRSNFLKLLGDLPRHRRLGSPSPAPENPNHWSYSFPGHSQSSHDDKYRIDDEDFVQKQQERATSTRVT